LPSVRHSAKPNTRQKAASGNGRRPLSQFAKCQLFGTRQNHSLLSAELLALGKNLLFYIFLFFNFFLKFFCRVPLGLALGKEGIFQKNKKHLC
jgi:hypothetical protein